MSAKQKKVRSNFRHFLHQNQFFLRRFLIHAHWVMKFHMSYRGEGVYTLKWSGDLELSYSWLEKSAVLQPYHVTSVPGLPYIGEPGVRSPFFYSKLNFSRIMCATDMVSTCNGRLGCQVQICYFVLSLSLFCSRGTDCQIHLVNLWLLTPALGKLSHTLG